MFPNSTSSVLEIPYLDWVVTLNHMWVQFKLQNFEMKPTQVIKNATYEFHFTYTSTGELNLIFRLYKIVIAYIWFNHKSV